MQDMNWFQKQTLFDPTIKNTNPLIVLVSNPGKKNLPLLENKKQEH